MIVKDRIEFDKLFTDFSDAVKEKKYAKMSYQTWNKIKNNLCALGDKKDFVEIKNNADSIRVQFHANKNVSEFIFSWDDCSFGNFLYDKLFKIEIVGIRDTLEEKPYNWKADYMEPSPVDSGEWWGEVDKPLKLTYVGDDVCLKNSKNECIKINASPLDSGKCIAIAGDCVQPNTYSIDIPDYATDRRGTWY